jgi:hypothetical protein
MTYLPHYANPAGRVEYRCGAALRRLQHSGLAQRRAFWSAAIDVWYNANGLSKRRNGETNRCDAVSGTRREETGGCNDLSDAANEKTCGCNDRTFAMKFVTRSRNATPYRDQTVRARL